MMSDMNPKVIIDHAQAAGANIPNVAMVIKPRFSSDPPQRISMMLSSNSNTGPRLLGLSLTGLRCKSDVKSSS